MSMDKKHFASTLLFLADVDDRTQGHFDHDAQNAEGPNLGEHGDHGRRKPASGERGAKFVRYNDDESGEALFRQG